MTDSEKVAVYEAYLLEISRQGDRPPLAYVFNRIQIIRLARKALHEAGVC